MRIKIVATILLITFLNSCSNEQQPTQVQIVESKVNLDSVRIGVIELSNIDVQLLNKDIGSSHLPGHDTSYSHLDTVISTINSKISVADSSVKTNVTRKPDTLTMYQDLGGGSSPYSTTTNRTYFSIILNGDEVKSINYNRVTGTSQTSGGQASNSGSSNQTGYTLQLNNLKFVKTDSGYIFDVKGNDISKYLTSIDQYTESSSSSSDMYVGANSSRVESTHVLKTLPFTANSRIHIILKR